MTFRVWTSELRMQSVKIFKCHVPYFDVCIVTITKRFIQSVIKHNVWMPNHIMKYSSLCDTIIILFWDLSQFLSMNEHGRPDDRSQVWTIVEMNDLKLRCSILGIPFETIIMPRNDIVRGNCKNFIFHIHSNDSLIHGFPDCSLGRKDGIAAQLVRMTLAWITVARPTGKVFL